VEAPNSTVTVSTSQILATIEKHASSIALILLPGIQFYTGQYFDIKTITAYAHSKGLLIGWDLAHAVGNVDVHLHDWDVDFAAWCTYKYMNSGPGAMAALFVHERHGKVDKEAIAQGKEGYRPRLCGWWGGDKSIRFQMSDEFIPIPGAAGFQVGNSSALGVTAVLASLEIFSLTSMEAIRAKSVKITGYLQQLLCPGSSTYKWTWVPILHHHSIRPRRTRGSAEPAACPWSAGWCHDRAAGRRSSGGREATGCHPGSTGAII